MNTETKYMNSVINHYQLNKEADLIYHKKDAKLSRKIYARVGDFDPEIYNEYITYQYYRPIFPVWESSSFSKYFN
jgi:hypothetical protein